MIENEITSPSIKIEKRNEMLSQRFNWNQDIQATKMKTVLLITRSVPTFRPSDQCILGDLRDFLTPAMASGQSDR